MLLPCSLICLICLTVSLRMAHLSGLTLKLSMLERLAEISSASSSMYLLSCSLLRLSHLPGNSEVVEGTQGGQVGGEWVLSFTLPAQTALLKQSKTELDIDRRRRTYPRPGVSQVNSLRLRSEHRGSKEFSPMPLIFSTFQQLRRHSCK